MDLSNLRVIVTGASSGIGKITCEILSEKYHAMVIGIGYRNEESLIELKQNNYIIDYIIADITKEGECKRIITTCVEDIFPDHRLTTLINNAGIFIGGSIDNINLENYTMNMNCNVQAPFELMIHAIPYLKKETEKTRITQQQQQKQDTLTTTTTTTANNKATTSSSSTEDTATAETTDEAVTSTTTSSDAAAPAPSCITSPSIINVSSVNGKQAFAGCVSYCMSKAAVDQLTRCSSVDLAKYGIRVNSVNPGVIQTNLHLSSGLDHKQYNEFIQRSINVTHPLCSYLQRVGQPYEVAELIAFLISNNASFITGECIAIDGGRQNLGAR